MLSASQYRAKAVSAQAIADGTSNLMLRQQWARTAKDWLKLAGAADVREKRPDMLSG
jgi:hypothetical protein